MLGDTIYSHHNYFNCIKYPFTTTESYTEKEFYTEQVPYNTTETYYEKESYIDNVPLKFNTTVNWHIY